MARSATSSRSRSTRSETDSFGPIDVPADRYWGAQTERSRQNFRIGHDRMPMGIVHALGIVKLAAAQTNREGCANRAQTETFRVSGPLRR